MSKIIPVILCGGSGTRLWPYSRTQTPKQFLKVLGTESLLQKTARRAVAMDENAELVVVTLAEQAQETRRQLSEISPDLANHVLAEPRARNTAAAIAYAMLYVERTFGPDAVMCVLPADHHIGDETLLNDVIVNAFAVAEEGYMVTFGITPTRAETGYGYIRTGGELAQKGAFRVAEFLEKPSLITAEKLLRSGEYLWSTGMHMFKASQGTSSFRIHDPETLDMVAKAMDAGTDMAPSADIYTRIKKQPFEKSVTEKAEKIAVVPCDPQWSDVGSWESLWEIKAKDENGNACEGNVHCENTQNSLIIAKRRMVACVGVKDLIVIEMDDAVLIADKKSNDSLKALVEKLRALECNEVMRSQTGEYAWGSARPVIDTPIFAMREMVIEPGNTVHYRENRGNVNIFVADGDARITSQNVSSDVSTNGHAEITKGAVYGIENAGASRLVIYEAVSKEPVQDNAATPLVMEFILPESSFSPKKSAANSR